MTAPANSSPGATGVRLTGWKAIAAHIGRGVRTAQRWERESGLPVRRMGTPTDPGRRAESVFAYVSEIDEWLTTPSGVAAVAGRGRSRTSLKDRRPATRPTSLVGAVADTPRPGRAVSPTANQHVIWALVVLALLMATVGAWRESPASPGGSVRRAILDVIP